MCAVALGIIGGAFSLSFMALLGAANNWYHYSSPGWMGGRWWRVAVTAAAGFLVGLLRGVTRLPRQDTQADRRCPRRNTSTRPPVGEGTVPSKPVAGSKRDRS